MNSFDWLMRVQLDAGESNSESDQGCLALAPGWELTGKTLAELCAEKYPGLLTSQPSAMRAIQARALFF